MMGGDLKRVDAVLRLGDVHQPPKHRGAPLHRRRLHNNFVSSNPASPRPSSAISLPPETPNGSAARARKPRGSPRPGSAPRSAQGHSGWTPYDWTPRAELLASPYNELSSQSLRKPATEELQQELQMTGSVLRAVQDRLKQEREQRVLARTAEELALMDVKLAREAAVGSQHHTRTVHYTHTVHLPTPQGCMQYSTHTAHLPSAPC